MINTTILRIVLPQFIYLFVLSVLKKDVYLALITI